MKNIINIHKMLPPRVAHSIEHWCINQFLGGNIPENATIKSLYRELMSGDYFDWYIWEPFEGMNEREVFENILHMRNSLIELFVSLKGDI